jgi:hypothetical protein
VTVSRTPTPAEVAQALRDAVEHDTPTREASCLALAYLLDALPPPDWHVERADLLRRLDALELLVRDVTEDRDAARLRVDEVFGVLDGVMDIVRELPCDLDEALGPDLWARYEALGDPR